MQPKYRRNQKKKKLIHCLSFCSNPGFVYWYSFSFCRHMQWCIGFHILAQHTDTPHVRGISDPTLQAQTQFRFDLIQLPTTTFILTSTHIYTGTIYTLVVNLWWDVFHPFWRRFVKNQAFTSKTTLSTGHMHVCAKRLWVWTTVLSSSPLCIRTRPFSLQRRCVLYGVISLTEGSPTDYFPCCCQSMCVYCVYTVYMREE